MERNELKNYLENIYNELNAIYEGNAKNDDGEQATFYDYFQDPLYFEYTISRNGEYLGVRVYVTIGGPNVWIDTRRGEIGGAWGTERADRWLPPEIASEIDAIFSEYYETTK